MITPFFGYFEQAWIDHQTDHGQHPDLCIGLPDDQIQDRVASWLLGFSPLMPPESRMTVCVRAGIVQRFYGGQP